MIAHLLIFISFIELITSVLFLSNHIPQNNFIGIRTKETFQNKKLWYKINQRFAIGFYLTGIIHMMYYLLTPNITKEKILMIMVTPYLTAIIDLFFILLKYKSKE